MDTPPPAKDRRKIQAPGSPPCKSRLQDFARCCQNPGPGIATATGVIGGHENGEKRAYFATGENADTSALCEGGGKGMVETTPQIQPRQ